MQNVNRRSAGVFTWIGIVLCSALTPMAQAQNAGTISGTVLDQAAHAIPGAKVVVKNDAAIVTQVTTDDEGHFSATDSPPAPSPSKPPRRVLL